MTLRALQLIDKQSTHREKIAIEGGKSEENFIIGKPDASDELSIFEAFPATANVAAQWVFGGCRYHDEARRRMAPADWPMLWLQGDVCPGRHISGAQAFVIDGQPLRPVRLEGHTVGSAWSDSDADYCLLAGILPTDITATRATQTHSCFEQFEAALRPVGMDFSHVVRTWLYMDHLLDWYDEFNAARTAFFHSRKVFEHLVPASTGIGASNPAGAALACGALAIRPRHHGVRIHVVASPLQREATEYRSSFSRAVEVKYPDRRLLMISGTASIDPDGKTLYEGDVVKQIQCTLDVVEAILESRGMRWQDTTRAIAYFQDIRTLPVFEECCRSRGIHPLPVTSAYATVCRSDLLFEIELDATGLR